MQKDSKTSCGKLARIVTGQLRGAWVPIAVAVVLSVVISRLAWACVPILAIAALTVAYARGWRIRICRSGDNPEDKKDV